MMPPRHPSGSPSGSFAYRAKTPGAQEISGTIDASSQADARQKLQALGLQEIVLQIESQSPRAASPRPLRGEDFMVFNQQLAQLTAAGLPVEHGLRLVAHEMNRSSMRHTLDLVASELESGKSLPQAVAAHRSQFPPLYSELIDAGIRAGNLSGILLNLGSHLTLIRRLQAMLWQTLSYPIIIVAGSFAVFYFILVELVPKWEPLVTGVNGMRFWIRTGGTYNQRTLEVPLISRWLFAFSEAVASIPIPIVIALAILILIVVWAILNVAGRSGRFAERLILPLPLVGIVLRRNLISRWCHAVALAADAGMDLPAAIKLADDAAASPLLQNDGDSLIVALNAGQPLSAAVHGKVIPATVIAAMEASADRGDLPATLRALSQMYQQQAELRVTSVQAILTPILLLLVGLLVGGLMVAMFAPLLALLAML
jgi:type IV pilus assembly protein PilC